MRAILLVGVLAVGCSGSDGSDLSEPAVAEVVDAGETEDVAEPVEAAATKPEPKPEPAPEAGPVTCVEPTGMYLRKIEGLSADCPDDVRIVNLGDELRGENCTGSRTYSADRCTQTFDERCASSDGGTYRKVGAIHYDADASHLWGTETLGGCTVKVDYSRP